MTDWDDRFAPGAVGATKRGWYGAASTNTGERMKPWDIE